MGDFAERASVRSLKELGISLEARSLWAHEMTWTQASAVPSQDAVAHELETAEGGALMLSTDPALVALVAERLLNCEPSIDSPLRPVTQTDRAVTSRFSELFATCLQHTWEDACGSSMRVSAEGAQRDVAGDIPRDEPVLMFAIELEIFGTFTVIYCTVTQTAFAPVRVAMLRPARKPADDDDERKRALQAQVARVPVDVRAQIATLRMTPSRIAGLAPGDLIELPNANADIASLVVDGVTVRRGTPGEVGHRIVVSLTDEPRQ